MQADHRPWPAPTGRAAMTMRWRDLAFLHWPVPPAALARHLPDGLALDTFDGAAWLGVVPFEMDATRFRYAPPFPTATRFAELNVRTYVTHGERPGVWFFSLDAASKLAVRGARATFRLPYFDARMSLERDGDALRYTSERTHRGVPGARFAGRYGPAGPPSPAAPGTLEHFLTERYCLYSSGRRGLVRGEVDHDPWPLQPARVELDELDMTRLLGLELEGPPAHAHFARSLDVAAWWPVRA